MIKVVVNEDSSGRLSVSTDIWVGDETIDLPPKVYESYMEALYKLQRAEHLVRDFVRFQERQRSYLDD